MFNIHREEIEWGGRKLVLETGKIARQADGAVWPPMARRLCLPPPSARRAQARASISSRSPSTIRKSSYAAGKIPGGYFKREGRPTERETLISRLIDRPIRPLFVDGYRNETQVVVTVLSHDLENDPDIVALVAASAALTLSGIPFMGPIGAARVGYIAGEYMLNPPIDEMANSELDLVVAGTADAVLMVESEAQELSEEIMLGAVMFGHREMQAVIDGDHPPGRKGARKNRATFRPTNMQRRCEDSRARPQARLPAAYQIPEKHARRDAIDAIKRRSRAGVRRRRATARFRDSTVRQTVQGSGKPTSCAIR